MADIQVAQGDYGFDLTFTIQTATSGAYDLTGKVATLKVWSPNRPGVTIVSASTTVATPTSGVAVYTAVSTDFVSVGRYNCEIELTEAGMVDSTKTYTLEVVESP